LARYGLEPAAVPESKQVPPVSNSRVAVYTDFVYRRQGETVWAEHAFVLFIGRLADHLGGLVVVGREDKRGGTWNYRLPEGVEFVPLPYYPSLAGALRSVPAMAASLSAFWRTLAGVDAVWLLGPTPLTILFAALARLRGRAVVLGVRQDLPRYARSRHPHRPAVWAAALALEALHRVIARRLSVVAVGPELARAYRRARRLLPLSVSLVSEADIETRERALERSYEGELRVLSVGRIDAEKNPLLLADVLQRLGRGERRWRLVVCGEGPMDGELRRRLEALGVEDRAELRGYVPLGGGLFELYRESHLFLHVSSTEGLPQVLFEAFAAGLPTVATAVGSVPEVARDSALLIPPEDPDAAAEALERLATDSSVRERLVTCGLERASSHTVEAESARVARFIEQATSDPWLRSHTRRGLGTRPALEPE
jgi:glycosyltransferase involved in cell wall biosynthesis